MSWLMRKAISLTTVTLTMKQYVDATTETMHIEITSDGAGGTKGTAEHRVLDWKVRENDNRIFGRSTGQTRWQSLAAVNDDDAEGMKTGLEDGTEEVIEGNVENQTSGWTAHQIWGFEIIESQRYHVRHVVVRKGSESIRVRMVYDWIGSN
jgi:hypothetical protein